MIDINQFLTPEQVEKAKKAYQARQNAQKSSGPKTEEGKRIAAQNARKHGYASAAIVLTDEDREAYDLHLDSYLASFKPVTQVECDHIRRAADAQWRLDRLTSIETGLLDLQFDNIEFHHYLAITFLEKVKSGNPLDLCRRYQSAAARDSDRAIKMFLILKNDRLKDERALENQSDPNELMPERLKGAEITPIWISRQPESANRAQFNTRFNTRRRKDRRKVA
jgi:hypothetical protein